MCDPQRLKQLEDENHQLKQTNKDLKDKLEFMKMHPVLVAGLKGETLVCDLVGGELTSFAASYDIKTDKCKIEVKYSNLGVPVKGSVTRRWSWGKPLGWKDKGKDYDFLILVGEKDDRFPEQYPESNKFVWFLIPRLDVEKLMFKGGTIGGIIQITTNFNSISNQKSKMLLKYLKKEEDILALIENAQPE